MSRILRTIVAIVISILWISISAFLFLNMASYKIVCKKSTGNCILAKKTTLEKTYTKYKEIKPKMRKIEVPRLIIYAIIIFSIIVICLQLLVVLDIASRYGEFTGLSDALTIYKDHTSYSRQDLQRRMSFPCACKVGLGLIL